MFFIQSMLAAWYVVTIGTRFYNKEIPTDLKNCKHVVIKTIYDYDITFYYREECIEFTEYRFCCWLKRLYKVHNVYVVFGDTAPLGLQVQDNVISLTIANRGFYYIDEKALVDRMINVYTTHVKKELQNKKW